MIPIFGSLLTAAVTATSGLAVSVTPVKSPDHSYYVSIPVQSGTPEFLRRVLLAAAARRTLNDGHRSFTTGSNSTAPTTEGRLDLARPFLRQTAAGPTLALYVLELPDELFSRGIDAQKALDALAQD